MKKMRIFVAAFVVAGLGLTSCSSDDNSSAGEPATIEKKWNQTQTVTKVGSNTLPAVPYEDNVADCSKNYIEFAAGGVYKDVVYFKQGGNCQENIAEPGTWSKTDSQLVINNGGDLTGTYTINKLTLNALEISTSSVAAGVTTTTTVYFTQAINN